MTWARFWAVDLHVHTPASQDVDAETYGGDSPEDVVQAALSAGLDAIAITDHNTTAWCEAVAAAGTECGVMVLPGVEISTSEGHLLAIFEIGTPAQEINDVLVRLGIKTADHGKLNISAEVGFERAAQEVTEAGGLAIAAHIDRTKGLLKLPVQTHVNRLLALETLAALVRGHEKVPTCGQEEVPTLLT